MTPETITALINLGAAGAVIVVVGMFLNYIVKREAREAKQSEARDKSWQAFFTTLNARNCEDTAMIMQTQQTIVKMIKEHDERVDAHIAAAAEVKTKRREKPTS